MRMQQPPDSPLVDLLDITDALGRRSAYGQEVWERVMWETVASIYADGGGRYLPDGDLHITVPVPPIIGVRPAWAMAKRN